MTKYKLIIFDLDGTLADTSPGILECHRFTNAAMGRPIADEGVLYDIIGGPLLTTYKTRFGYSEGEARKAIQIYRTHYAEVGFTGSTLYTGIVECLRGLKEEGCLLAVATLKAERLAKQILHLLEIGAYFDLIHGMDEQDTFSKQDLLRMCMNELQVRPSHTVLIGDSIHDADGAKQAGIDFLGVTYGFGFKKGMTSADYRTVDSCREIRRWLQL